MFSRRQLLATTALLPLASCAAPTPNPTPNVCPVPTNVLDDIQAVAAGLNTMLPYLTFITDDLRAQVSGWITQAVGIVDSIKAACTGGGDVNSLVQNFAVVVQKILSALSSGGVELPIWISGAVAAISALMPIILAYLGVTSRHMTSREEEVKARNTLLTLRPVPNTRTYHHGRSRMHAHGHTLHVPSHR